MNPILVLGMSAGGTKSLPVQLIQRIHQADLLVGGRRHLAYFPQFAGERLTIAVDMERLATSLQTAQDAGRRIVVLASGDPLCYGIGATLRRYLEPESLEIIPAPTAFQLAFASLCEPWQDAVLLSAHARPLEAVVQGVQNATKAAILTDPRQTPAVIAQALLKVGLPSATRCAVCENLGATTERIVRTTLQEAQYKTFAELNVFVVWNQAKQGTEGTEDAQSFTEREEGQDHKTVPMGLPDNAFETSAGQITKREIRLLTIAELGIQPGNVVWDIGAGSGSVGIEIARAIPNVRVYAVEKRSSFIAHMQKNIERHSTRNVLSHQGIAPDTCMDWPRPHAIFVGGSGGCLAEIVEMAKSRLYTGGRLVLNLATLENLYVIRKLLPTAQVNQIQISRGTPIGEMLRFQALNPIFMVRWVKP